MKSLSFQVGRQESATPLLTYVVEDLMEPTRQSLEDLYGFYKQTLGYTEAMARAVSGFYPDVWSEKQ